MLDMSVTFETSHVESWLKEVAKKNMRDMSVTAETSHEERLPLKEVGS